MPSGASGDATSLPLRVAMPGPGFGKGNAHHKPGVSQQHMALKRQAARAHESRMCPLDTAKEQNILDLIRNSSLDAERKRNAVREVREWLSAARKGLKGTDAGSGVKPCWHKKCSAPHNEHSHKFLCQTRMRRPTEPELQVREAIEVALQKFLADCQAQLAAGMVRAVYKPFTRHFSRPCLPAIC